MLRAGTVLIGCGVATLSLTFLAYMILFIAGQRDQHVLTADATRIMIQEETMHLQDRNFVTVNATRQMIQEEIFNLRGHLFLTANATRRMIQEEMTSRKVESETPPHTANNEGMQHRQNIASALYRSLEDRWLAYERDATYHWCNDEWPKWLRGSDSQPKRGHGYVYSNLEWRKMLQHVVSALGRALPSDGAVRELFNDGDIYLFGVAQGDHMAFIHSWFSNHRIFGFDSFKGLPDESHGASQVQGAWQQGEFTAKVTPEKLVQDAGGPNVAQVVPGFFSDSLRLELVWEAGLRPAFYVDIDCDLYSSTISVLNFLFSNRIAQVGTIISYDDWWTIPCKKFYKAGSEDRSVVSPLSVGEGLAHSEITQKFGVKFRCLAGPCKPVPDLGKCHLNNNWGTVFIVEDLYSTEVSTGVELTARDEQEWLSKFSYCNLV